MNLNKAVDSIAKEEGFSSVVYKCTEGYDTIGYGFAIKDLKISEEISKIILRYKIYDLHNDLIEKFPWYIRLPVGVQSACLDMAYQMGIGGLSKFRNTITCLRVGNFQQASIEVLDSRYAKQTPNRANRVSETFKRGV